jgi:membrane-bound ClpP family serine protease
MVVDAIGVTLVIAGIVLFVLEIVHPGALLLIPGSILLVAGLLYIFFPSTLLNSGYGPLLIISAAIVSALIELPYYRYIAPNHRPMSTTTAGLTGEQGIVVTDIVPNTIKGKVRVKSEIWSARSDRPIATGTMVRVVSGEGVAVKVIPLEETPAR